MSIMIFGPESWVSKLEGGKNRVRGKKGKNVNSGVRPRYSLKIKKENWGQENWGHR